MDAQSYAESRKRRVQTTIAEVDQVLAKSARYRKRQTNPFWIALPVGSGVAFAFAVAFAAKLLVCS